MKKERFIHSKLEIWILKIAYILFTLTLLAILFYYKYGTREINNPIPTYSYEITNSVENNDDNGKKEIIHNISVNKVISELEIEEIKEKEINELKYLFNTDDLSSILSSFIINIYNNNNLISTIQVL